MCCSTLPPPGARSANTRRARRELRLPLPRLGYALDGSLRGVPHPKATVTRGEGQAWLVSLRVEEYAGMVFRLVQAGHHAAQRVARPAKKWMDLFMKQPVATRSGAGEHRFTFPGN